MPLQTRSEMTSSAGAAGGTGFGGAVEGFGVEVGGIEVDVGGIGVEVGGGAEVEVPEGTSVLELVEVGDWVGVIGGGVAPSTNPGSVTTLKGSYS